MSCNESGLTVLLLLLFLLLPFCHSFFLLSLLLLHLLLLPFLLHHLLNADVTAAWGVIEFWLTEGGATDGGPAFGCV